MQEETKKRRGNPKFVKGVSGNPAGKKKGTPNKNTAEIKAILLGAFNRADFLAWTKANPDLYYTRIIAKLMPQSIEVTGDEDRPVSVKIVTSAGAEKKDNIKAWAEGFKKDG